MSDIENQPQADESAINSPNEGDGQKVGQQSEYFTKQEEQEESSEPESKQEVVKEEVKPTEQVEKPPADETLTLTKSQMDAEAAKIRQIAERKATAKATREADERYKAEIEKLKTQQNQQTQQQAYNQQPPAQVDPNTVWDDGLGVWVSKDMTIAEYGELAASRAQQQNYQQQQPQQVVNDVPAQPQNPYSEDAENQAIEAGVEFKDFEEVMKGAPVTPQMVNAICLDKNGMQNLYELQKERPHELYKISQLSPERQQKRMWELNQEFANKKAKIVQSKATPQPAPLDVSGNVSKPRSEMSFMEKKRLAEREIWGS
jgi:hypothetical protein